MPRLSKTKSGLSGENFGVYRRRQTQSATSGAPSTDRSVGENMPMKTNQFQAAADELSTLPFKGAYLGFSLHIGPNEMRRSSFPGRASGAVGEHRLEMRRSVRRIRRLNVWMTLRGWQGQQRAARARF